MAEVIALAKPSDCCSLAFRGQVCEVALLLTKLHQKAPHDFLCHQQSAEAAVKGEGQSAKPFLATCGCVWYLAASGSTAPPRPTPSSGWTAECPAVASRCGGQGQIEQKRSPSATPWRTHRAAGLLEKKWWALLRTSDTAHCQS